MNDQLIRTIVDEVLTKIHSVNYNAPGKIPIGVSARHVHLSEEHVKQLFGDDYALTEKSSLSQAGQFAAKEQVTLVGPKATIHNVRVLGPARKLTQVEISATDARHLGVQAPLRHSADVYGSAPITLVGPKGSIFLQEGCIIAAAHIHMSPTDAERLHVTDGQLVSVRVLSDRPLVLNQVKIRVSERFRLEMHVDTDEGNAALILKHTVGEIVLDESIQYVQPKQTETQVDVCKYLDKRLITEQDVMDWQGNELVVSKKTIVTALARDLARKRSIRIVRQ